MNEDERELRDRLYDEAQRLANGNQYAPVCGSCDRRLYKDNFNGMWVCYDSDHGGYQTTDQISCLIYTQMIESAGLLP